MRFWRGLVGIWLVTAQVLGSLFMGLVLAGILVAIFGSDSGSIGPSESYVSGEGTDKIVVIELDGVVGVSGGGLLEAASGISTESVRADLDQAASDSLVKGIVLRINSPGGSAVVSDEIFEEISRFKEDTGIPVVASLGDTAASGGYYIAAAADKIVANPSTITGSIGVILEFYNAQGLLENIGVSSETFKSGEMKDIGSFSRGASGAEREVLQSVVDGAFAQFVDRVVEGRDMERSEVVRLADGRIYTGGQAEDNGLVDALGNLATAVDEVKSLADIESATVVRYERGGFWQSLMSGSVTLPGVLFGSELQKATSPQGGLQYLWRM